MPTLPPHITLNEIIQWLFGSIVVLIYALDRFETPVRARGTTTFMRYCIALTGYIISLLMLYLLLGGAFTDADAIMKMIMYGTGDQVQKMNAEKLPGPLFAALLLTSLLPHVPYLQQLDEMVKRWFQRLGNIPWEVRTLSGQLQSTRINPTLELMDKLREPLEHGLGIQEEWLKTREKTLAHKWARVGVLYAAVNQPNCRADFARYMGEHKNEFKEIDTRIQAVLALVKTDCITLDKSACKLTPCHNQLFADLAFLHEALCDFIAGALMQKGRSRKQRDIHLREFGFETSEKPSQMLTAHDIFLVGVVIFLMMLFTTLIINQNFSSINLAADFSVRVLFMVPIIYCVAIAAAIYPKAFWPFADIHQVGSRPIMGYVLSGLLAVVATFLIQLLFRYVQGGVTEMLSPGAFMKALHTNVDRWPWLLMNFLMTIVIAWAADNHALSREKEPRWLRLSETLGLAAICGVLQWVTLQLLLMVSSNPGRLYGKAGQMILTSTLVGGIIGFFVPHYYRMRGQIDATSSDNRPVAHYGPRAPWMHG